MFEYGFAFFDKRRNMKIQDSLEKGIEKLKEKGIEEANQKVRILLAHILHVSKEYLWTHNQEELNEEKKNQYEEGIKRLENHEPLAYIIEEQEFMKLNFYVNANVLIPRADTEILVEEVIQYCQKNRNQKYSILDLCTGSGAIALSLAYYLPNCEVIGVDISKEALEVARINQERLKIHNVRWICSDMLNNVETKVDILVSNPPYIQTEVIETLEKQVQQEPKLALDGGEDGLKFYRKIVEQLPRTLKQKGSIFLEIGYDQRKEVSEILEKSSCFSHVVSKKDLAGLDRVVIGIGKEEEKCPLQKK